MINSQEFIKRYARKMEVTHEVSRIALKAFQDLIFEMLDEIEDGSKIKINDFLVFEKKFIESKEKMMPDKTIIITDPKHKFIARLTERYETKKL